MLVDGELPAAEIEPVRKHLADCAECRDLEKDFLFFRHQIKSSVSEPFAAGQTKISPVASRKPTPFWRGWISLPVPALALFIILLIALGAWLISSGRNSRTLEDTAKQSPVKNVASETGKTTAAFSLARYDAGGRAEIYVVAGQTK